jgi:hypothetical protein
MASEKKIVWRFSARPPSSAAKRAGHSVEFRPHISRHWRQSQRYRSRDVREYRETPAQHQKPLPSHHTGESPLTERSILPRVHGRGSCSKDDRTEQRK